MWCHSRCTVRCTCICSCVWVRWPKFQQRIKLLLQPQMSSPPLHTPSSLSSSSLPPSYLLPLSLSLSRGKTHDHCIHRCVQMTQGCPSKVSCFTSVLQKHRAVDTQPIGTLTWDAMVYNLICCMYTSITYRSIKIEWASCGKIKKQKRKQQNKKLSGWGTNPVPLRPNFLRPFNCLPCNVNKKLLPSPVVAVGQVWPQPLKTTIPRLPICSGRIVAQNPPSSTSSTSPRYLLVFHSQASTWLVS